MKATTSISEVEEYMAALYKPNDETRNGLQRGSYSSSDSSDEIEIIRELKVNLDEHRCDLCCKGTFLVDKLLQFGSPKHKYVCELCIMSFKTKASAVQHAKMHEHNAINEAEYAGEATAGMSVIEARTGATVIKPRTGESVIKAETSDALVCNICFKLVKSELGLKRHTTVTHGGMNHSCSMCGAKFKSLRKFREHCYSHTSSPNLATTPTRTKSLTQTCSPTQPGTPKLRCCPSCNKTFLYKKSLKQHVCSLDQ